MSIFQSSLFGSHLPCPTASRRLGCLAVQEARSLACFACSAFWRVRSRSTMPLMLLQVAALYFNSYPNLLDEKTARRTGSPLVSADLAEKISRKKRPITLGFADLLIFLFFLTHLLAGGWQISFPFWEEGPNREQFFQTPFWHSHFRSDRSEDQNNATKTGISFGRSHSDLSRDQRKVTLRHSRSGVPFSTGHRHLHPT